VQSFVNSCNLESGGEELTSPTALSRWLARWELVPVGTQLAESDLREAVAIREGVRALLATNNGAPPDEPTVKRLNRRVASTRLRARFSPAGSARLEPDGLGWQRALARLLQFVVEAEVEGQWARLKACRNDRCRWAFFDRSKNRSGKWCTMRRCGNRRNAQAYRSRRGECLCGLFAVDCAVISSGRHPV